MLDTQAVTSEQPANDAEGSTVAAAATPSTALKCLALIAVHHGVRLSSESLAHRHAVGTREPSPDQLIRIAQEAGFRARIIMLDWHGLLGLRDTVPALLELTNGNWVVLAGIAGDNASNRELSIIDPLAVESEPIVVAEDALRALWAGTVMFVQPASNAAETARAPFGFRWFLPEIMRQRRLLADVGLAAVVLYGLGLATPLFSQLVIDKVLVHESYATLYVLAGGVAAAMVFEAIFTYLRRYLLLYATNRVDIRVAMRTFGHLLGLPIGYFERIPGGVLAKHMQQASRIREFLTGRLLTSLIDALSLFVFLPVLFLYSVHLTLIVLAFTACVALVVALLIGPFRERLRALYDAEGARQAALVETIHGMRTIKSLAMEGVQARGWDRSSAQLVKTRYDVDRISAAAQALTGLLDKLTSVAIISFGALDVFDHRLTVGALVAFNMLSSRVSGPLVQIVTMMHEYQEVALSVRMLGLVMNEQLEQGSEHGLCPELTGDIEFDDVLFDYGSGGAPALNGVSFRIPAGSVIGVVGRSGSGKTTITRLIQRLYTPQSGIIRLDGHDIREIDTVHLRRQIGIVLQESFLFRGSIRDNIAAAKPHATLEEIARAARIAGAVEFIERLPRGFDTILSENAENLSGGQRQRLAIARALLSDPRLLILDEATSALDPESEAIIRRNLSQIANGRTVIIVSHRLTALTATHATLVLDRGHLSAFAPHEQLLRSCTVYRTLWTQQARSAA
jgi:ATP-binding cassette subfamily B protein